MIGQQEWRIEMAMQLDSLTADGLEEVIAVVDKAAEAADVAAGAHRLAVALVVDPEHAVPGRRQPHAAFCIQRSSMHLHYQNQKQARKQRRKETALKII